MHFLSWTDLPRNKHFSSTHRMSQLEGAFSDHLGYFLSSYRQGSGDHQGRVCRWRMLRTPSQVCVHTDPVLRKDNTRPSWTKTRRSPKPSVPSADPRGTQTDSVTALASHFVLWP